MENIEQEKAVGDEETKRRERERNKIKGLSECIILCAGGIGCRGLEHMVLWPLWLQLRLCTPLNSITCHLEYVEYDVSSGRMALTELFTRCLLLHANFDSCSHMHEIFRGDI